MSSRSEVAVASDVWEPPEAYARAGRLNIDGEPLLYVSVDHPAVAVYEGRIMPGDLFAMAKFRPKETFSVARVADADKDETYSRSEERNLMAIQDFLAEVFNERADPDLEQPYVGTEIVVKNYYDYPSDITQGWGYKSLAQPGGMQGWNLAMRPGPAREFLELVDVQIGICNDRDRYTYAIRYHLLDTLIPQPTTESLLSIHDLPRSPGSPPSLGGAQARVMRSRLFAPQGDITALYHP
ncbi:hypothetical protein [Paenarthrobacter ilicis]|uniref:hypothetical protein n=1 Tax=Paenarthrobacter ilicis TaxID=43665 RepID=UPI0028D7C7CC|nr:hypothetical protein [Paenarthrobacter ilicis]